MILDLGWTLYPLTSVFIRERGEIWDTQRRKPREDRGRDWGDVATSRERSGATKKLKEARKESPLVPLKEERPAL